MDWLSAVEEIMGVAIPFLDSVPALRVILSLVLLFFLPGFAWTLVFFSGRQLNIIERLAISIGLSIAIITLSIFASNRLIGVAVTGFNTVLIALIVTIIPLVSYYVKKLVGKR